MNIMWVNHNPLTFIDTFYRNLKTSECFKNKCLLSTTYIVISLADTCFNWTTVCYPKGCAKFIESYFLLMTNSCTPVGLHRTIIQRAMVQPVLFIMILHHKKIIYLRLFCITLSTDRTLLRGWKFKLTVDITMHIVLRKCVF